MRRIDPDGDQERPPESTSGARACGGQRRRWDLRRTLTSLAAPNPDRRLRGSFGRTLGQPALEAMKAAFAEQIRIDTMTPMWLSKDQISTWRAAQVKDDVNKRRLGREASKDGEAGGAVVVPSAGAAPAPPPSKRTKMTKIKASTGRYCSSEKRGEWEQKPNFRLLYLRKPQWNWGLLPMGGFCDN